MYWINWNSRYVYNAYKICTSLATAPWPDSREEYWPQKKKIIFFYDEEDADAEEEEEEEEEESINQSILFP